MPDFPDFVKNTANRIATSSQFTDEIEGYVFDGADGGQVALWAARADRVSQEHVHDFDEYVLVIEGRCALLLGGERIELRAGQEFVIPSGTRQPAGKTRRALERCAVLRDRVLAIIARVVKRPAMVASASCSGATPSRQRGCLVQPFASPGLPRRFFVRVSFSA